MAKFDRKRTKTLLSLALGALVLAAVPATGELRDKPAPPVSELFWQMLDQAKWGEAEAQFAVGMMYLAGQGVEKDPMEGARWVKKAAEQDHPYALFKMGELFEKGLGVAKDLEKAAEFFKKAALKGIGAPDEKAYYRQLFEAQMDLLKWKRDQEAKDADRKYEDQVRREQNQHQIDLFREVYRNLPGWWDNYPYPPPPGYRPPPPGP